MIALPQGQAIVSVIWAVIGTAVLVACAVRKVPDFGNAGLAVLAVTVGKLLTVTSSRSTPCGAPPCSSWSVWGSSPRLPAPAHHQPRT